MEASSTPAANTRLANGGLSDTPPTGHRRSPLYRFREAVPSAATAQRPAVVSLATSCRHQAPHRLGLLARSFQRLEATSLDGEMFFRASAALGRGVAHVG